MHLGLCITSRPEELSGVGFLRTTPIAIIFYYRLKVFNHPNISVFIYTGRYSKAKLMYFANPSESVTAHHKKLVEAEGFGSHYKGGYGFGIVITLEKRRGESK